MQNHEVIATTKTEKTDGFTLPSPAYINGVCNYDGFFKFNNLSYNTEYQVRVFLNDTMTKITLPFTIQNNEAWVLDSVEACQKFGWYPKNIANKKCYYQLMPQLTDELTYNYYDHASNPENTNIIYPNPAQYTTYFEFKLPKQAFCTINLLRLDMSKIKTIEEGNINSGYYLCKVQVEDIENGMYFVELRYEENTVLVPFAKFSF